MTQFEIGKMIGEFEVRIKTLEKENNALKKRLDSVDIERVPILPMPNTPFSPYAGGRQRPWGTMFTCGNVD